MNSESEAPGPCITLRGLTRRFGTKTAVIPTDLEINSGMITGLLGPNGSGKSTLMRMMIGLVRPSAGTVVVAGVKLRREGTEIRKCVCYAPGEIAMYGELKGRDHLHWLLRGRNVGALEAAIGLANRLELPLHKKVRTYSHGMKRQLLVVAALAPEVPVRILDEPTEGLDPSKRRQILDMFSEDAARGTTILLSSHHLQEVDRACDRLIFLSEGAVVADENAATLRARARCLVKLSYRSNSDFDRLHATLSALGHGTVHRSEASFSIVLTEEDPRPFLSSLSKNELPQPATIDYGTPSLGDLYRDLYGVEGV